MRISQLARHAGLSRSTLLYYDRIGLLTPSGGRNAAGYRIYSPGDRERLEAIRSFRKAGLDIADIRRVLSRKADVVAKVLRKRMREQDDEIRALQAQQRLLGKMLQVRSLPALPVTVDKRTWIAMLRAAGMDDAAMDRWHAEFEQRAPEAHHRFLLTLGISEDEALSIRRRTQTNL